MMRAQRSRRRNFEQFVLGRGVHSGFSADWRGWGPSLLLASSSSFFRILLHRLSRRAIKEKELKRSSLLSAVRGRAGRVPTRSNEPRALRAFQSYRAAYRRSLHALACGTSWIRFLGPDLRHALVFVEPLATGTTRFLRCFWVPRGMRSSNERNCIVS